MKAACDIFANIEYECLRGAQAALSFSSLEFASSACTDGSLFFCVPGTLSDGHDFAADALLHGAAALVVERELPLSAAQFKVADTRQALAYASANFYDHPSQKLALVGITGTNGKTTSAFLTEHIAYAAGARTGLIGTVECHILDQAFPSIHTTPESRDLQKILHRMVNEGVQIAALEVSSHAIDLGRIAATHFEVAAFSNLSQDHLDYHKTMENYFAAKAALFLDYDVERRVICVDTEYGVRLCDMVRKAGHECISLATSAAETKDVDIFLKDAYYQPHSTSMDICIFGKDYHLNLPLVGRFNVENALVACGIAHALHFKTDQILKALESAPQIPGRLECVRSKNKVHPFSVLVDYAHTPDSLAKVISAVRQVCKGRIICVFGCGGDRDKSKRPKMGAAACAADLCVVTSDNPRTEDPKTIIDQVMSGMDTTHACIHVELHRADAIEWALNQAGAHDCVLICGKGHEDYQIIGTKKRHFDDREFARKVLDGL